MVSKKQQKIDAFKRREAFKEQRKSILIVCEGSKTEPTYFNSLRQKKHLSTADIVVAYDGSAPISAVNCAIELKNKRKASQIKDEYDTVYCVIDVEIPQHNTLSQAIDKANANGLEIILSNPCFEYWYLLHFEKTSPSFNSNNAVISLLKKYIKNYDKSDTKVFDLIYPNTDQAIKNSKEVLKERHHNAVDLQNCNPSTNVYIVVEELLKMV